MDAYRTPSASRPGWTRRRIAAVAMLLVGALLGFCAGTPAFGPYLSTMLEPEPARPYPLLWLVIGAALLGLTAVTVAGRPPNLRVYAAILLVATVATLLTGFRLGVAQRCCETGWLFGYGYPYEFWFNGVSPDRLLDQDAAERAATGGRMEPVAFATDLLFWGSAAFLAWLPLRTPIARVARAAGAARRRQPSPAQDAP